MVKTSFTDRSNYFGSNGWLKGKFSRPRTDAEEVHGFRTRSYCRQRGSTSIKMDAQQLQHELRTTFGSNMTVVEELQGTREEQRRTEEEQRNPKCGSTVERCRDLPVLRSCGGRRRFSRQVRVMQRQRLTKARRAAAAAELEKAHGPGLFIRSGQ